MASGIVESSQSGESSEQKQQQQQQQQGAPMSRSKLLQKLAAAGSNLPAFVAELITTQAIWVAGTEAAAFSVEPVRDENGQPAFDLKNIAHIRPDNSPSDVRQQALQAFAEIVREPIIRGQDAVVQVSHGDGSIEPQFCLVTLLRSDGNTVAVSAVITRCRDEERAKQRLASMELVAGYFELYAIRRRAEQSAMVAERHQHVFNYGQAVAGTDTFKSAAMNLCNEFAARTGAARVSIGWVKGDLRGDKVKLQAMSHTEQFDRKQELSVLIEKVMEECLDQEEIVELDPLGKNSSHNVTRDAAQLSRIHGGEHVISLPLRRGGEIHGVITLEFAPQKQLSQHDATALAVAVELLAPQLYDRYQNDRWLITKAAISTRETAKLVIGPKHMLAKLITVLVIAGVLFTVFYKKTYHVTAPFKFAPVVQRQVSAPFEGTIEQVFVVPRDHVKKGDPLVQLRTIELQKEYAKNMSEALKAKAQAQKFRTDPTKQADAIAAEREGAAYEAEAAVTFDKIQRSTIRADIDGEVLVPDLRDKVGSTVKLGDPLLQLAEHGNLRAELDVAERDVQEIKDDGTQTGWIATNAMPQDTRKIRVERVIPLGTGKEGENIFRVYATLEEPSADWRPGMQGEANVDIGKRRFIWIYTHRLTDFVRLKVWKWF